MNKDITNVNAGNGGIIRGQNSGKETAKYWKDVEKNLNTAHARQWQKKNMPQPTKAQMAKATKEMAKLNPKVKKAPLG